LTNAVVNTVASTGDSVPIIAIEGLVKTYQSKRAPDRTVLDGVELSVSRGEFVAIVGPSGAGKTTLLRCMSGLLPPTSGTVSVAGTIIHQPPESLAIVFQDYSRSLLPWLTVRSNVELPLVARRVPRAIRRARSEEALEAVGLTKSSTLHPWQLSGGMQQRVAIARALAYQPDALLMDEPFASVDAQTRAELEDLTMSVRTRFGMTVVLVTHDIDEAVYMGDRVIVLSGSPTRVSADIGVDLGTDRDQINTKSRPEFAELRAEVFNLIRKGAAHGELLK
jgi:NitT/TauT family transport system ATP-binding protein